MYKVNIITSINYPLFTQEYDIKRYNNFFDVYENSEEEIVWDLVIVYEDVAVPQKIKYREGGLVFISGEPPLSRTYPQEFVDQFDVFQTTHPHISHPHVIHSQLAINWHFGLSYNTKEQRFTYEELKNMAIPEKRKMISIITSSKKMMPGHNYRQRIISKLKESYSGIIDFYGNGVNLVDTKCDALMPYRFHICMENSIVSHYWSEKFADPLLGYSIPIYSGCPNMSDYFERNGFIEFDMKRYESLKQIIDSIIVNPELEYKKHLKGLIVNRDRLLNNYSIFNVIEKLINCDVHLSERIVEANVIPYEMCKSYKRDLYFLGIKRKIKKFLINCGL